MSSWSDTAGCRALPDELEQPLRLYCDSVEPMGRLTGGWDTCAARDFWVGRWVADEVEQLVVLRHGAVNQLTAYDLDSARPFWDVGFGCAPVGMAIVAGDTAATARAERGLLGVDGNRLILQGL